MPILNYSNILKQGGGMNAGQTAIDTSAGLQGLQINDLNIQREQAAQQAQQKKAVESQNARKIGAQIVTNGTNAEIVEFGTQHPEVLKQIVDAVDWVDEQSKGSRLDYAKRILSGDDPVSSLEAHIKSVRAKGGAVDGLEKTLALGPEEIRKAAETDLAMMDNDGWKAYSEASGRKTPMTEYQQAMVEGKKVDQGLKKTELDNKKIENELKKETNTVKLEALKDKQKANLDKQYQIKKGRSDAAQSVVESADSTVKLINEIRNHSGFSDAVGAKTASSWYGLKEEPVGGTEGAGAAKLIKTLDAQNFLTAIGKFKAAGGAGALSDSEGKKLSAAISSLSRQQPEVDFLKSLKVVENLVLKQANKARPQIKKEFKLDPSDLTNTTEVTGDSVIITAHPDFGDVTEDDITTTMSKWNMTREQVLSKLGTR